MFLIILAGLVIGKLRIKGFSLGIAGILFVAIFVGFLINLLLPETNTEIISNTTSTMKTFSKLGSSLFVSVIGLQTGFSIKNSSKGSILSFLVGILMSLSGVAVMLIISHIDQTISYPTLLGVLCGALTSTPALSSVCELIDTNSTNAIWGYGCSYILGVLFVVLSVQFFSQKKSDQNTVLSSKDVVVSKIYPELILICITALLGNTLGSFSIPLLKISLGSTAYSLLIGLIVGYITQKYFSTAKISSQILNSFKIMGLALFFAETGYSAGIQSISFDIRTVIYGSIITLSAILCGLLLCKVVFSRHQLSTNFIIAGGMTSSPAYGAISHLATDISTNHFSFAYFGALISLIISLQIICI